MLISDFANLPTPDLFEWKLTIQRLLDGLTARQVADEEAGDTRAGIKCQLHRKKLLEWLAEVKFQIGLRFRRRKKKAAKSAAPKLSIVGTQRISIKEARQHPIQPVVLFRPGGKEWAER